jgi:hypothetical protein
MDMVLGVEFLFNWVLMPQISKHGSLDFINKDKSINYMVLNQKVDPNSITLIDKKKVLYK